MRYAGAVYNVAVLSVQFFVAVWTLVESMLKWLVFEIFHPL